MGGYGFLLLPYLYVKHGGLKRHSNAAYISSYTLQQFTITQIIKFVVCY